MQYYEDTNDNEAKWISPLIEGIYCPLLTPFNAGGTIDCNSLASNIRRWNDTGLAGYVVLGSTGETPYLESGEKRELIAAARQAVRDKQLIAGTGHETTVRTVELTREAADLGADMALVLTPHYYKPQMTDTLYERYYDEVADAAPIPVLIYNVPAFTGIDLSAKVIAQLCRHPNIVGIKDSTNNLTKLIQVIEAFEGRGSVLVGNAGLFLAGLGMGAQGAVLAICNIVAAQCVEVFELVRQERFEEARGTFKAVLPLATQLVARYGIPAIKSALDELGFYGGPPRKPLTALPAAAIIQVKACLRTMGL